MVCPRLAFPSDVRFFQTRSLDLSMGKLYHMLDTKNLFPIPELQNQSFDDLLLATFSLYFASIIIGV